MRRVRMGGRVDLRMWEPLDRVHARDCRRYAQVVVETREFQVAHAMLSLPPAHRRGLLLHELGHVINPEADEDGADRAAEKRSGERLGYDLAWPGKGLQVALGRRMNPRLEITIVVEVEESEKGLGATAYAIHQRRQVGLLEVAPLVGSLSEQCERDLALLIRRAKRPLERPLAVVFAQVHQRHRAKGIGVLLYGTMLDAISAVSPEAYLGAGACEEEVGGETTPAGRRVWASERLQEMAIVQGLVATGERTGTRSLPFELERTYILRDSRVERVA